MKRSYQQRIGLIILCLFLPLLFAALLFGSPVTALVAPTAVPPPDPTVGNAKSDPDLQTAVADSPADEKHRVIVHLQARANLAAGTLPTDPQQRHTQVLNRLQETAAAAQATLQPDLTALAQSGAISQRRDLWIINAISLRATPDALRRLAAHPAVAEITLDAPRQYIQPPFGEFDAAALQATNTVTAMLKSWGLSQINAPHVWNGLGIDGSGVTVAIMDSGVDWQHPDLLPNYRGNLGGGTFDHAGSWYYPVSPTITTPLDLFGHGTHVAGTAVGQNGIGVAPGARWIAVGLTDETGLIFDSDVHAGFQWLLAPDGNPALAPDVVNNSWGSQSTRTVFLDDVNALHAAGIVTVFSAGNAGPSPQSLGVPAAYPDTVAVGASDDGDALAWFSSRGPSALTDQIKPQIVAPGTAIYSSLPGGQYGSLSGTSMAAPHTTGAIALLLSAQPSLNMKQLTDRLTDTAVPIDLPHPNFETGWGRLDAYAAVRAYVTGGTLRGTVRSDGVPLPHVPVTVTNSSGGHFVVAGDANGRFQVTVQPGSYILSAAPFGYAPRSITNVTVTADVTTTQNVDLDPLPQGTITGVVRNAATGAPIAGAAVTALNTPVSATTDANGRYTLSLPVQQYKLLATATGHSIGRALVLPTAGSTDSKNFTLDPIPSVLVVDDGQWQFQSYADYYHDALTALNVSFDRWSIRHPLEDAPTSDDLTDYDVVIWADPNYSPGYIGANDVITDYLGLGGNLIISGQNVGLYDGGPFSTEPWWYRQLGGVFLGKTAVSQTIQGAPGTLFADLSFTLNGGSSAGNQRDVDASRPHPDSVTDSIFHYENGLTAGMQAGRCRPFRIVYLGFGLEGVSRAADRAAILSRSFDYFAHPRTTVGVRWEEEDVFDYALRGSELVYTVTVRNMSETITDTFDVMLNGDGWPTSVVTPTLTLGPCETGQTAVHITIPNDADDDRFHTVTATAVSRQDHATASPITFTQKTPGQILLVDDDRWYDRETIFIEQLNNMGLAHDVWETGWKTGQQRGSPPADLLQAYEFIIWFTAYDWFQPVTPAEREALTSYLDQGGRLFLTSQDFMFYHWGTPLARDHLGIIDYRESITPTAVFANHDTVNDPVLAGPLPLDYGPYRNNSDGLVPAADSESLFWHNAAFPAAVATAGDDGRAVFMGFPFETLPPDALPAAMNRIIGWLGDLGTSTIDVDARAGAPGATRTFTITVRNVATAPHNQVTVTNALPDNLMPVPGTLSGAAYDAANHTVSWSGTLPPGGMRRIVYQATSNAGVPTGTRIDNPVTFSYARHGLAFEQAASFWIDAPDLSGSTITTDQDRPFAPTAVTYTLTLQNSGLAATDALSTTLYLPDRLMPVTDTLQASRGGYTLTNGRVLWTTDLAPGERVTASLMLTRTASAHETMLPTAVVIQDGVTQTLLREHRLQLLPFRRYFPFFANEAALGDVEGDIGD